MRKKNSIVIEKLIEDSACELRLMQADLEGEQVKPTQWSRRFAASGKSGLKPQWSRRFAASGKSKETQAPKIRESY